MTKNLNFLYLIIILYIFESSLSKKNILVLEGDNVDLSIKNSLEYNYKLFLIFHVRNCPYCTHALKVLKDQVIKHYDDDEGNMFFGSIDLDNQANIWLGLRFNITKIPYIILIENKKMYHFESQFEESLVVKFIDEEKNIEDALDVPEPVTFGKKFKIAVQELTERMQTMLDKFGIKLKWNNTMTHILLVIFFGAFVYVESKIFSKCRNLCKFNTNKKNIKKKDEKDEKEIKKEKKEKKNKNNDNNKGETEDDKSDKDKVKKE